MGVKTIITCDKCGEVCQDGNIKIRQPVAVGISLQFGRVHMTDTYPTYQRVWCRECIVKTGIHPPIVEEEKEIAPEEKLSTTEKLALLLEELGFQREEE